VVRASGWEFEGQGSNSGPSRQALTPGCLKQQNIPSLCVPFLIDLERRTLKTFPKVLFTLFNHLTFKVFE